MLTVLVHDAAGVMLPLFAIIFGDFTNAFGMYIPPCFGIQPVPGMLTNDDFLSLVNNIALKFLYVAIGAGVAAFLQQAAWAYTGRRQANKIREKYLHAVLRQDITFFDTQASTGN